MYCEICKKDYHNLSNHLILKHKIFPKDYFDEYLKTEENSHCRLCHAELKDFIKLSWGYGTYCKECSFKDKFKRTWKLKSKLNLILSIKSEKKRVKMFMAKIGKNSLDKENFCDVSKIVKSC